MTGKTVTAEWALQGKTAGDTGYRLLECSDGIVSRENFEEVLSRYSPGTLEDLPQLTISWLSDRHKQNYLAVAIHDVAEGGMYDARGREIVFTSYFCVPYDELAGDAVSYQAMYEGFRGIRLQVNDRARITTELAVPPSAWPLEPPADNDPVLRVAALLLTNKPVCILGADGAGLDERLLFLDSVMSLLPYGMRSRLSASTWASSTYQGHKFRLFFASAPRESDDHVVVWGKRDRTPIGHPYSDEYLNWMGNQAQWPLARMAAQTERLDFSPKHVLTMLELMGVAAFGSAQGPGADLVRVMSPEELLGACAGRLDSANPERLGTEIKLLRRQPGQPTPEERAKYRRLIFEHRLLRKDLPVSKSLTAEFYDVLLRLSFGAPLTYANYCDIEDCVGCAGQQLHKSLLQAIDQVGFADLSPQLLVHNGLDEKRQREALRSGWVPSTSLVAVAADRQLRVPHARIICDLAVRVLREWSGPPDWEAVRVALRRRGYLAPVLQQRHHDEPQYQADVLAGLLQAVYGRKLDRPAVAEIMGNIDFAPTAALLAAVVTLADPADAGLAVWEHARSLLFNTNFDDRTGRHLRNLLQGHDQSADGPRTARPPRISPSFSGVGSRWLARAVLPHSRGAEVRPGKEETPPPR